MRYRHDFMDQCVARLAAQKRLVLAQNPGCGRRGFDLPGGGVETCLGSRLLASPLTTCPSCLESSSLSADTSALSGSRVGSGMPAPSHAPCSGLLHPGLPQSRGECVGCQVSSCIDQTLTQATDPGQRVGWAIATLRAWACVRIWPVPLEGEVFPG